MDEEETAALQRIAAVDQWQAEAVGLAHGLGLFFRQLIGDDFERDEAFQLTRDWLGFQFYMEPAIFPMGEE